ncbi:toprim domain-containing protein [Devosia sp.]|uniref:toprim domain-containing protein n=1 Tax=Devosia sp. TaxID=1871048 RepID=UPI001A0CCE69|nr:toprim domain-containing protein [Devosia sp.]MBE0577946.1 toprim domain-containing protein [Devosia sp.]
MSRAGSVAELAQRLAHEAEAVCKHYLSNGQRSGNYWLVGDVDNSPGRSLYVRLEGPESGPGAAGKWTDAATGEFGDLLDIIAHAGKLTEFRDVADEARRFLSLPRPERPKGIVDGQPAVRGSKEAARRLHAMTVPIEGTIAERYLRHRGITDFRGCSALRFHANCYYRDAANGITTQFPALIAAVTNTSGELTGLHRTWLSPDGSDKAPVESPRRAMGQLLGSGVRFGIASDQPITVMAAGEGLETLLSLRMVASAMPMVAGLSSGHLGALLLPPGLQRLYMAGDADAAGRNGTGRLSQRAQALGIEVLSLRPRLGDFNDDLRRRGLDALSEAVGAQLLAADRAAFMPAR